MVSESVEKCCVGLVWSLAVCIVFAVCIVKGKVHIPLAFKLMRDLLDLSEDPYAVHRFVLSLEIIESSEV